LLESKFQTNMKNDLFWEIPSSVDLEGFLKKYPPSFKYKRDHFYYIIDYLSRAMDFDDLDDNAGFINTNAQKLQNVNHNYKEYLGHLLKYRFIQTDMKYIPGKKSRGYRISNSKYHHATIKKIPITDFKVHQHKLKEVSELRAKLEDTRKHYPHLTKWFEHLHIDVEGATKEVEKLFPEKTGGIRGTRKGQASDWQKRYRAINAINKIANHEIYYSVDENVGRFHSNLTNFKKELRKYITYNGQKLVNVDIKNSQPLFSTLLFDKKFYTGESQYININSIPTILPLLSNYKQSISTITIILVKTLYKFDYKDINIYLEMVNSGMFYEKISELMYPTTIFDKKKIKTMIFVVFFSNNKYMGQPRAQPKREFKALFPQTYEIFRILKLRNHTALAHLLQRIESLIMIQNVVVRISKERPELPIFTIHDSVVTTVGNEEYVTSIIEEEVFRLTGLNARLGIEFWEE